MGLRTGRVAALGAVAVRPVVTTGGALMVIGMFAPWLRSGAASRTSFEMVDLIERLGFARSGPIGLVIRAWPLAPLLVVIAVVVTWSVGGRIAAVVAIGVGHVVGGVGLAVRLAPQSDLIGTRWGALLTGLGGVMMIAGGSFGLLVPGAAGLEDTS